MSRSVFAALSAAGLCVVASSVPHEAAFAQETGAAAATAGGDVTADEATPLPPVVVQSPAEPPRQGKPRKKAAAAKSSAGGEAAGPASEGAATSGAAEGPAVAPFTLGQLDLIGGSTITNEAMWTFNKQSLDQAVNILPGVSMNNTGGSRNERDIYVRGFDRFRVPLYMDGVRIYLPYDNRLDFNRFLTPDLSEIQVQKGYVSVLNGPGGMGGAINLVSRKPTKEIELEGRSGLVMNGDLDDMNQWSSYAYAGTRQKGYYAQISGTIVDQDHFSLSDDFTPASPATTPGYNPTFPYEDGGNREHSDFEDWRINAKIGITPNATDEYSLNYTTQAGEKGAPLHTDRQIVQGIMMGRPRFWDWPKWDVSTLSWLSKTQVGEQSYVKTNAYYNTFKNDLLFYPDSTYTDPFTKSPYDDASYGGFVEFGTEIIPMNTLKAAIHYRRDEHEEGDINYTYDAAGNLSGVTRSPSERDIEETWSFALENTFHATRSFDIVTGVSYDRNEVLRADGTQEALPEADAWNWQAAAIYSYSDTGKLHADVSSRTRFPTLFDRYSTRFGARTENPNLDPERATNYEIGWSDRLYRMLNLSTAVFYSDIEDSIQNAFVAATGNNSILGINADGETYGFEISADWDITPSLRIGGNYTYLERDMDFRAASLTVPAVNADAVAAAKLEGTPRHEAFIYASWKPTEKLTLTPSLEIASDRTALFTSCGTTLLPPAGGNGCPGHAGPVKPNYVEIGAYTLVNFQAEYAFNENATLAVGATNIFDENYVLAEGFPEAGRQFFANARVKF